MDGMNMNTNENQQQMPGMQMPMMQQPKKLSAGARVGYGFLSFAPGVACIVLQYICLFVVLIPMLIIELAKSPVDVSDMDAYMAWYTDFVLGVAPVGVSVYHVVGTIVFGLWFYFSFRKPRPGFVGSFKKLDWKNVLITVLCGVSLCFFANGTVCLESIWVPEIVEAFEEMAGVAGLGTNLFVILASILLAPIGEEYICRGLIQKFAKKAFGKFWIANIIQALVFGLIHMNWVQGIYAFVIGLVLGWLVERYDSIVLAMILHCVVNLSSSTWVPYALTPLPFNLPVGLILTIVPMVVVAGLLIWGGKKTKTA